MNSQKECLDEIKYLIENTRHKILATHYWSTDIPYSGSELDLHKLLCLREALKQQIVSSVYEELHPVYPSVPIEVMEIEVLCTNVNKAFLLTPFDANEIISRGTLNDSDIYKYMNQISEEEYVKTIRSILERIVKSDLRYSALLQRGLINYFINYHDIVGHGLVRNLVYDEVIDEMSFSERMQRDQPLNIHYIFGRVLYPMYVEYFNRGLDRGSIYQNMCAKLALYLEGKLAVIDSEGEVHKMDCPITALEAQQAVKTSSGESTVSFYAPLLYTRYRSDRVYSVDIELNHFMKADTYSKLVRIANRTMRSVYQDSFYIRDEVIQSTFKRYVPEKTRDGQEAKCEKC